MPPMLVMSLSFGWENEKGEREGRKRKESVVVGRCKENKNVINHSKLLKNVSNCFITNISSYLEISGGQSSDLYLNCVHFFNTSVN
jgi:hypothetical protein